jgi:F0F1-type ATP synthase membrane subunit b/b'
VQKAKAVPLTEQVRLDRDDIVALLDEMRATLPDEVRQARWLVRERQETLAEATREADRLVAEAREQAARASAQSEIVRLAEREADAMIADARRRANSLLSEVEEWADATLALLEVNLHNFLAAIRRGRERLHGFESQRQFAAVAPHTIRTERRQNGAESNICPARARVRNC